MNTITQQIITVDYQITRQVKTVSFLQFDTNEIKFIVEDNGVPADLSNITQIVVNFKRPDKKIITQFLNKTGNEIVYRLTNSEMAKQGVCEMVLQLYDGDNDRVSIAKFNVNIQDNIEIGEEPTVEEVSLVTQLVQTINERIVELIPFEQQMINSQKTIIKPIKILHGGKNPIVIDSATKKLIFPSNTYDTVFYIGDTSYTNVIPPEGLIIDLTPITGSTAWCLLFKPSDKSFLLTTYNTLTNYATTHSLFATIRHEDGKYIFNMDCPFILDGLLFGISNVASTKATENKLDAFVKGIAHRGYSTLAPENTLIAYRAAKDFGFSYVEADIEWTSDNVPVLLHDETIDRTSNGVGSIKNLTLDYVKTLDFGAWKNIQYTGTKIPTFEEFLILCRKLNLHPYIEIKNTITNAQATILVNLVKKFNMGKQVSFISFNEEALDKILTNLPTARIGLVMSGLNVGQRDRMAARKTSVNEVFLDMPGTVITKAFLETVFALGMEVEAWTVNNPTLVHSLVEMGVSGFTTDLLNIAEVLAQQ